MHNTVNCAISHIGADTFFILQPFACCIIPEFISTGGNPSFLGLLSKDLLELKFYEKNNDLYKFSQV